MLPAEESFFFPRLFNEKSDVEISESIDGRVIELPLLSFFSEDDFDIRNN